MRTALVIPVPEAEPLVGSLRFRYELTVGYREEVPSKVDAELARGLPVSARATHVVQFEEFALDRWRERQRFRLGR